MGFNAELLVVYPDRKVLPGTTIWVAEEVISFGHITRLQKLVDGIREGGSHVRAGICMVSCLMQKLINKLVCGPQWKDFAPRFLVYRDGVGQHQLYETTGRAGGQYLDCGTCSEDISYRRFRNPRSPQMEDHNRMLGGNQKQLDDYVANHYNVIIDSLVMWEECRVVASWLDEAEQGHAQEWQELEKDQVSLAKVCGWREYLRQVGRVEARVLFIFPRY